MAIIQDWKIRSTTAQCEMTSEPFADGERFYTCIFDDPESDGFIRKDYSEASWKIAKKEEPEPFSFWKSTYKAPVIEEVEKRFEDTSAEGMLRRFIEEDDSRTENARYILALMLERKKALLPTDAKETETRKLLFYEHAENGDVFIVADPELKLDEIEVVQREVAELLALEEAKARGEVPVSTDDETSVEADTIDGDSESEGDSDEGSSSEAEEVEAEKAEPDEDPAEDSGEESAETEDKPIASAGEESA